MSTSRNKAKEYRSGTLVFFAALGVLLVALGVLTLLSTIGVLRGRLFAMSARVAQGLSGSLSIVLSLLLCWAGVLLVISYGRGVSPRALILTSIVFLCVLGAVNLLCYVGVDELIDYAVAVNNSQKIPDADGYWNVMKTVYGICEKQGGAGGALGVLLAWPLRRLIGKVLGVILLSLAGLGCVLLSARFNVSHLFQKIGESSAARREKMRQRRAEEEQRLALEEQQRQAELDERLRRTPAYTRRGMKNAGQAELCPPNVQPGAAVQGAQPFPPYGSMLQPQALPSQIIQPAYAMPHAEMPGMYIETIAPDDAQNPWKIGMRREAKSDAAKPLDPPADDGAAPVKSATNTLLSGSRRRAMERLEQIRKHKVGLIEDINGDQAARQEQASPETFYAPIAEDEPSGMLDARDTVVTVGRNEVSPSMPGASSGISVPTAANVSSAPSVPKAAPIANRNAAYMRPDDGEPKPKAAEQVSIPEAIPAADNAARKAKTVKPKPAAQPPMPDEPEHIPYCYPSIDLLKPASRVVIDTREADKISATCLEKTLDSFGIPARVQRVTHGPAVTRFELGLISQGINVKKILGIADNIALDLAANGGVRIEIPIQGTNLFGVEVPNKEVQTVTLSEVLLCDEMRDAKSALTVALGRDIAGRPILCDLAKMPHLLIAGQTGSGKSVCINSIVNSLLYRVSPDDVRMIMIDPKVVELQCYNVVPHLLIPVVSDPHKAAGALAWAVAEMFDRYHKMQSKNVREISAYNAKAKPGEPKLPRIVIIIDELSDLMLACKKEVEESIIRLAQLARAAGIHMVVATQRPTVDVITGLIKANIPSRIAFAVSSSIDSRTILDQNGADKLLGHGDMFYAPTGTSTPIRVQGCFLSDAEIERIVDYIGQHSKVEFDESVLEAMDKENEDNEPVAEDDDRKGIDDRLLEAAEMVINDGQASISMLQRRMKIGYARAGRLIDDMAARGIISKSAGSKPREILMGREEFEQIKDTLIG